MAVSVCGPGNLNNADINSGMSDQELIEHLIDAIPASLATRKEHQKTAALQILNNNYTAEEMEKWVKEGTMPSGASGWD